MLLGTLRPVTDERPLSALPSVGARVTAFVAICVSGLAGALSTKTLEDPERHVDGGETYGV